jgi:hypothetical protein
MCSCMAFLKYLFLIQPHINWNKILYLEHKSSLHYHIQSLANIPVLAEDQCELSDCHWKITLVTLCYETV